MDNSANLHKQHPWILNMECEEAYNTDPISMGSADRSWRPCNLSTWSWGCVCFWGGSEFKASLYILSWKPARAPWGWLKNRKDTKGTVSNVLIAFWSELWSTDQEQNPAEAGPIRGAWHPERFAGPSLSKCRQHFFFCVILRNKVLLLCSLSCHFDYIFQIPFEKGLTISGRSLVLEIKDLKAVPLPVGFLM